MTATKNFRVDSFVSGLAIKAPVLVATSLAITLSGEQTVNGRAVFVGDRVLVKDQADPVENGIYNVETSAWQRAGDFDGERDIVGGTVVPAYRVSDGVFVYWIIGGDGESLSPGTSALSFSVYFDPAVGSTIPASTQASSILRGDGAAGWVEETDLVISSGGVLTTTGSLKVSDGVDSLTISASGGVITMIGTGGINYINVVPQQRFDNVFYTLERAGASADLTGYGQWWARTSDGSPMFTNDAGTDFQLNGAAVFTPPLVLGDNEEIQWGDSTDLTMEWDVLGVNGMLVQPAGAGAIWAWRSGMQMRYYNPSNAAYIAFKNEGITSFSNLRMFAVGASSANIDYQVGLWDHNNNRFLRAEIEDYSIAHATAGSVSGVMDIDLEDGNSHYLALTENITTMTISNPPISGRLGQLEIEILQDSPARTIAWPASVKWPGGTAPDLTTVSSTHLVHLRTRNAGTTWLGTFLENFS